jgi:hypothetical protein
VPSDQHLAQLRQGPNQPAQASPLARESAWLQLSHLGKSKMREVLIANIKWNHKVKPKKQENTYPKTK